MRVRRRRARHLVDLESTASAPGGRGRSGALARRAFVLMAVAAAGFGLAYMLGSQLRSEPPARSRFDLPPLPGAATAPLIQPLPRAPRRPPLRSPEPPPVVIAPPPVVVPPPVVPPPPPPVVLPPPPPLPLPPPPPPG